MKRIIEEDGMSRHLVVLLTAKAVGALGEILDALGEVERIVGE